MGNGPTRLTRPKAQLTLVVQPINLEHHPINLVFQSSPSLTNITVIGQTTGDALYLLELAANGQALLLECLQNAYLSRWQLALDPAKTIAAELQRTTGSDGGIKLTQAASRGVTRIVEGFAVVSARGLIQRLKARLTDEHLTTHFQYRWPTLAAQLQRHIANGAHVAGDILTSTAITACCAPYQQQLADPIPHAPGDQSRACPARQKRYPG